MKPRARPINFTTGQTKAAWMAAVDAEFDTVDDDRGSTFLLARRVASPFSGRGMRRPASGCAAARYQHLHVSTNRKDDGPVLF
jgi:hypothetical protein